MTALLSPGRRERSSASALLALVIAAGIFAVDTLTQLDIAVAVLYVAVVMLMADVVDRRGTLAVGAACTGLTLIAFFAVHHIGTELEAAMRAAVSIAAIVVTTLLSLRNQRSKDSLRGQAALLDLTHDAILVRDAADTIVYWNHGAEELYGWSRREAVGRNIAELLGTVFPGTPESASAQLLRDARWEGELRRTRKDGSTVFVSSRWSLHRDAQARPLVTMETTNDITERKQSEDSLHKARAELAHVTRVATLGQLTASIAHEVNQPLAAIVADGEACLRWLRRPEPDAAEATASVVRMVANGRRAADVIARLRSLSRRETAVQDSIAINDLLAEACALIERELARHRVLLRLDLSRDLPAVKGDRVQLQQVVINLAVNAAQAMDALPGRRQLTIASRPQAREDGGRVVLIEVRDNGPGVDPQQLPRLFEAFFSSKPDGMGLGLSISQSIVEAHHGEITALRNPEGGMTFRIALPAPEEPLP